MELINNVAKADGGYSVFAGVGKRTREGNVACNDTAHVENKSGGIQYCSTEVYVGDLAGQGTSHVSYQARLIITETKEIKFKDLEVKMDKYEDLLLTIRKDHGPLSMAQ